MKKARLFIPALALALCAAPAAQAGTGHDHSGQGAHSHAAPVIESDQAAVTLGTGHLNAIVKMEVAIQGSPLGDTWASIPDGAKAVSQKGDGYYIVAFENAEADKTLYLLLSDTGEVYDANFTGEFGLE